MNLQKMVLRPFWFYREEALESRPPYLCGNCALTQIRSMTFCACTPVIDNFCPSVRNCNAESICEMSNVNLGILDAF